MKTKKVTYKCEIPINKFGIDFRKGETKNVPSDLNFESSECFEVEKSQSNKSSGSSKKKSDE